MRPHGEVNLHVRLEGSESKQQNIFKWAKLIFRLINAILGLFQQYFILVHPSTILFPLRTLIFLGYFYYKISVSLWPGINYFDRVKA